MIEVKGLSYRYPKVEGYAVREVSFSIPEGEIFGFLGPSGAGKSTTQKVLIGLLKKFTGSVHVLGKDIRVLGPDYYEDIGVSFELPNHYRRLTGLENLQFFRSLYSGKTEEPMDLLRSVGLESDARKPVAEFSKGMQMRLNFVRALLNHPKLLFLDEPTSGMDPANARLIKDLILREKSKGTTIFLTTHNMNVADELCDRVAFIVDGQIRLIGSPRELKIKHGRKVVRVEYMEQGRQLSEDFTLKGIGSEARFLELLQVNEIETIHTLEATLEDVFIACTGVRLA
jgi:fluoroquinolone transport system ATP-binding protein